MQKTATQEEKALIPKELQEIDSSIAVETLEIDDGGSSDDDEDPLPTQKSKLPTKMSYLVFMQAMLIYFIVACDSLCLTIIQPFLPEMVNYKFPQLPHKKIGVYVGLTLGAFSCARFFSSTYFGYYSDMYGRKYFLLLSLFVNFIATAIFGSIPIIELLILLRFFQGFLSSTNTLAKTVLVDIAKNYNLSPDERSLLFAYLGSAFALSRSISSSMGGLLVGLGKSLNFEDPYQFTSVCAVFVNDL